MTRFIKKLFSNGHTEWYLSVSLLIAVSVIVILLLEKGAYAKMDWEVLKKITLEKSPDDMVVSNDNKDLFILSDGNIAVYSLLENKVTDTIPVEGNFTSIQLSSDGERIFLTDKKSKQISILRVSPIYEFQIGKSPIIGKADAPVTLVAFFDFQCPYCARAYPLIEELLEKYPDKVNLVIKHFPLRMHKFAQKAAYAALSASKQNKYQEITKEFFTNYSKLNDETVKQYAEKHGLDIAKLEKDAEDPSVQEIVNQDVNAGQMAKVRGVPAMFINGRRVKERSLDALSAMVEEELKKTKKDKD